MIAGGYLRRRFLLHFAAILGALVLLLQLLDLFENARSIIAEPGGLRNLPPHVANRLPLLVVQAIPLSVLMAAILGYAGMVRHNELTALRAAGVSLLRLARQIWPAVLGIAVFQFIVADRLAPPAERRLQASEGVESEQQGPFWLRSGQEIVSAKAITTGGRSLAQVVIVERDKAGRATGRVQAREALWTKGDGWTLVDGRRVRFGERQNLTEAFERLPWPGGPPPHFVDFVRAPTRTMELSHLWAIVDGAVSGADSQMTYAVELHRTIARPLTLILLSLLALPAAHGTPRHPGAGPLLAMALGLCFLVFEGGLAAVGHAGLLPPLLAAWAPLLLFGLLGAWTYLLMEA